VTRRTRVVKTHLIAKVTAVGLLIALASPT
jgi:hypothetical protein